jgi:hypothetical protein
LDRGVAGDRAERFGRASYCNFGAKGGRFDWQVVAGSNKFAEDFSQNEIQSRRQSGVRV